MSHRWERQMNSNLPHRADADTTYEGKMTKEPESRTRTHELLADAADKSKLQKRIDGKMRRWAGTGLASGLGSTLLALPALAQATVEELYAFQFAETIPGVRSVKLLKDGDVVLKLANGQTIVVAAEKVQILESGAIMIAEDAVAEIAQFSLAAEAGGAASAGGISGVGAALGGLGLAGAAAAGAGGGGGGDSAPPPAPTYPHLNLSGVQSTALSSAALNINAAEGAESVQVAVGSFVAPATLNSDGTWSLSLSPAQAANLPQGVTNVVVRSLDVDGNEISTETVIFDIDTLPPNVAISGLSAGNVMNAAEQATDLIVSGTTDAEDGQTITVTVGGQTYTGSISGGQWAVTVPSSDLTALSDGSTITVTADVQDEAGNPAVQATTSIETDFTAPAVTLDQVAGGSIDLVDVGSDLSLTGTTTATDGEAITVNFNGQTYSTTASSGSWSVSVPVADLSGLTTGTLVSVNAVASDAAGNVSPPAFSSVPVDLTGPTIAISPLPVGSVINAAEVGADLTITGTSGSVQDGQQVTVTVNGQAYTGNITSGSWSVTVPTADLVALSDGGSFTITADVMDTDGLNAPQASATLDKDVTPPTLSIDSFSSGTVLNASERGTDLTVTGSSTAEDGQAVTVEINGQTYIGTVSGGTWNATIPAAHLSALTDGATISVAANVSDAAGNPASEASSSFNTDFTAPTINITGLSDGAVLNVSEQTTDMTVSGTSDAADGTVVTVKIVLPDGTVDVSGTTTVSGGTWSYTASSTALGTLQDGVTYNVTSTIADAAGNVSSDTGTLQTDFSAPSITLDALPIGPILDINEAGSDLVVSGSTSAEDGQIVSVTLNNQTYAAVVTGGTWSTTIPTLDLSSLSDSTGFTLSATVSDTAGNSATPATTNLTTDLRPILTINQTGPNGAVDLGNAQSSGVTVSGTSVGLSSGQSVNITLNGSPVGSATVAADGSWSLPVSATAFTGIDAGDNLNFQASATVSGGSDPLPVSDQNNAHEPGAYTIVQTNSNGSTLTFEIYADPGRDISSGLAITAELGFDPSVVAFDSGSDVENGAFDLFLTNPVGASAVSFGGAATVFTDLSQPLVTFTMTVQDASQPVVLSVTTPDGGPTVYHLGTDVDETLTATDVDNVLRGQGGDDSIDLTSMGRDLVVFEADPAENGVDTITGFTLGPVADVTDALMFSGLNVSSLRGNGTGVETLGAGDALGTNTGVVGFTTVLSDLTSGTIETAVESLTGVQNGDEIFVLATDGTDSVLVKVDYSAPGSATVDTVAQFTGLNDLSGLSADNILHTDPTGASV